MNRHPEAVRLSLPQYQALPEDDAWREELSSGWLIREPRPGALHAQVSGEVYYRLRGFVEENPIGQVFAEAGFLLSEVPPTVRGPDVSFIAAEQLPAETPQGFWPFAPTLAIEIVAPGNRKADLARKTAEYLAAGTREVWIVQPRTRTVVIHSADDEIRFFNERDVLTSNVLPGFELLISELFPD